MQTERGDGERRRRAREETERGGVRRWREERRGERGDGERRGEGDGERRREETEKEGGEERET